jgi:hypothetical protein
MTQKALNDALDGIRRADPMADLALELFRGGCTEAQLWKMLQGRNDPLGVELQNKFRDITHGGFTVNRYGVTRRLK